MENLPDIKDDLVDMQCIVRQNVKVNLWLRVEHESRVGRILIHVLVYQKIHRGHRM